MHVPVNSMYSDQGPVLGCLATDSVSAECATDVQDYELRRARSVSACQFSRPSGPPGTGFDINTNLEVPCCSTKTSANFKENNNHDHTIHRLPHHHMDLRNTFQQSWCPHSYWQDKTCIQKSPHRPSCIRYSLQPSNRLLGKLRHKRL